jgi:hypothetical protein
MVDMEDIGRAMKRHRRVSFDVSDMDAEDLEVLRRRVERTKCVAVINAGRLTVQKM